MSATSGSYIYTGPWINWSRGAILGSTITLTQRNGSLLTAFLGIFVTAAGAACWRILSFIIHQRRARQGLRDTIHHQQQAIFRNSSTPSVAAWQLTQLVWYWRRLADSSLMRNLPYIALALCNLTLFTLAGVFSSEVTKAAGNETLIMSPSCGYLLMDDSLPESSDLPHLGYNAMEANDTLSASDYSRACYGDAQGSLQCNRYAKPKLEWTSKSNVSCPFQSQICVNNPTATFEISSKVIDSHDDLGMNADPSERLKYRQVSTCSVLNDTNHIHQVNGTDSSGDPLRLVHYDFTDPKIDGSELQPNGSTFVYNRNDQQGFNGYSLTSYVSVATTESPIGWVPIPELSRTDADVTILFLAPNTISYLAPVNDPWFKATTRYHFEADGKNITWYLADIIIGVLACADQFEFCNPVNKKCTGLTSAHKVTDQASTLSLNKVQQATMLSMYNALLYQTTYSTVHSRGANSLRAMDTVTPEFSQIGLPDNQWTLEVTEWFAVSLAKLQQAIVAYATGPQYIHTGLKLVPGLKEICERQKIRSVSGYISFSVFGVSFILVVGGLLIFTALVLDTIIGFFRKRFGWQDHKRIEWVVGETLQLQRLAYEAAGQGNWSGGTSAVPVTDKNDALGFALDVDRDHPTLKRNGYFSVLYPQADPSRPVSSLEEGTHGPVEIVEEQAGEK